MYILLEVCQNPTVLRVIYFVSLLLDVVFVLLPIGLVIYLMIDLTKAVVADSEDKQLKSTKLVGKRILYAVIVFAVPWIVSALMSILSSQSIKSEYLTCLTNAKSGKFAYYDELLEKEEALEESTIKEEMERISNSSSNSSSSNSSSSGNTAGTDEYHTAANNLVNLIKGEVGKTDRTKYGSPSGSPWCAYFTSWALKNTKVGSKNLFYNVIEAEYKVSNPAAAACSLYNFYASSNLEFHYSSYYSKRLGKNDNYTPKGGDVIYFRYANRSGYWSGSIYQPCSGPGTFFSEIDHVGLVASSDQNNVYTVEGNCNNKVCSGSYALSSSSIVGYGSWYK